MLKMNLLALAVQKLQPEQTDTETDTQTDRLNRHTDRQTDMNEIITFPHTRREKITRKIV